MAWQLGALQQQQQQRGRMAAMAWRLAAVRTQQMQASLQGLLSWMAILQLCPMHAGQGPPNPQGVCFFCGSKAWFNLSNPAPATSSIY
jgi:hypothetical protein